VISLYENRIFVLEFQWASAICLGESVVTTSPLGAFAAGPLGGSEAIWLFQGREISHLSTQASPKELFRLDGRVAVVTGGASGIGRAIVQRFAESGACVRILDIDKTEAEAVARELDGKGHDAKAFHCDVTRREDVEVVFQQLSQTERIQILVNNAGVAHVGTLETTTEQDFDKVFQVNVKGFYNCMQGAIGHMKAHGGVILNMASIAGSAGLAERFAYSMSKGAVIAMTFSVARDFLDHKVRCNCISPARIHTPFVDAYLQRSYPGMEEEMLERLTKAQPVGRMGEPHEVASLALFLCSDEAAFITGVDYPIDGGFLKLRG
jgi:2-keto-3-deoxy-L-fuconate dehydrogenase